MEMEFFVVPGTDEEWHQYWIDERTKWYVDLGIRKENLRHYEHPQEKLSHYSKRTVDIEYRFQFAGSEWGELRSEEHTSELQSRQYLVCRLLLEKKKNSLSHTVNLLLH